MGEAVRWCRAAGWTTLVAFICGLFDSLVLLIDCVIRAWYQLNLGSCIHVTVMYYVRNKSDLNKPSKQNKCESKWETYDRQRWEDQQTIRAKPNQVKKQDTTAWFKDIECVPLSEFLHSDSECVCVFVCVFESSCTQSVIRWTGTCLLGFGVHSGNVSKPCWVLGNVLNLVRTWHVYRVTEQIVIIR